MKITSLIILSLIFAVSCQKKMNVVNDHVGDFDLKWGQGVQVLSDSPKLSLKRQDPSFGPEVEIESFDRFELRAIDKKIQCGSFIAISPQKEVSKAEDMKFKISPQNFPNLLTFPKVNHCQMELVLTSKLGSTMTKRIDLDLEFDSPQLLGFRSSRLVAKNVAVSKNEAILLERLEVSNPFSYPIAISVAPTAEIGFQGVPGYRAERWVLEQRGALRDLRTDVMEKLVLAPQEKIIVEVLCFMKMDGHISMILGKPTQLLVWRDLQGQEKPFDPKVIGVEVDELSPLRVEVIQKVDTSWEPIPGDFRL